MWRFLYRVALAGMGYMNNDTQQNGEDYFLGRWATAIKGRTSGPPVIFDVGANEGDFSAGVAKRLRNFRVHAFEPHPQTYERLRQRFAYDGRFIVNQAAVAASAGHIMLYDYADRQGSNMASVFQATFEDIYPHQSRSLEIQAITLDEYVERNGIDHISLIKIDVEGAEKLVLDGARRILAEGRVDAIQFEFNAHALIAGFSLLALCKMLPGYDIYRMVANGLVPMITSSTDYNSRVEIFKYCNCVALRRSSFLAALAS
jgi:FkbM family methyltransferase